MLESYSSYKSMAIRYSCLIFIYGAKIKRKGNLCNSFYQ